MTAINTAAHRVVMGKDLNPLHNEVMWPADVHAIMLGLFIAGEVTPSATAPVDTTKMWFLPNPTNAGNGSFKVYIGGAWQAVTSGLFFEWLRQRAGFAAAGGLDEVATDATLTGDGTPGNPLSVVAVPGSGLSTVSVSAPITGNGTPGSPIDIAPATTSTDGSLSAGDKAKLDAITLPIVGVWDGSNPPPVGTLLSANWASGAPTPGTNYVLGGSNVLKLFTGTATTLNAAASITINTGTWRFLGASGHDNVNGTSFGLFIRVA